MSRKRRKEKYLKINSNDGGYMNVILSKDKKQYNFYIHRLVLETFVCKRPDGMECRHLDGNPKNNHVDNLKWGTHSENTIDKFRHGYIVSDETRRKISESEKGKKHSDETRRKISENNKGRKHSDETKRKISERLIGHKHSVETRKKMSESSKNRYNKVIKHE